MSRNVIRDGHNYPGYIAEEKRLHDELAFTYRPMLPEEVEALEHKASNLTDKKKSVSLLAAAITDRLATWSEVDERAASVPISHGAVRHLPYALFNKLYRVVCGMAPPDAPPGSGPNQGTPEEADEYTARLLKSIDSPAPPGQALTEDIAKNLPAG